MFTSSEMIGASPRRKEDAPLLVGAGRFLDDLHRPGLVHLRAVRTLHAHARLAKVAAAEAVGARGALAAFAAADPPEVDRPIPSPYGRERHTRPFAQPVLARDTVRYVGEPVAVVVG